MMTSTWSRSQQKNENTNEPRNTPARQSQRESNALPLESIHVPLMDRKNPFVQESPIVGIGGTGCGIVRPFVVCWCSREKAFRLEKACGTSPSVWMIFRSYKAINLRRTGSLAN